MIPFLLYYGTVALAILWMVGLPSAWSGKPRISLVASGLAVANGMFASIGSTAFPRSSHFWFGGAGSGDGMALIGISIVGSVIAAFAGGLFIITAVVSANRKKTSNGEAEK